MGTGARGLGRRDAFTGMWDSRMGTWGREIEVVGTEKKRVLFSLNKITGIK